MTVGEIRKAIEGLPDDAFAALRWCYPEGLDPEDTLVALTGVSREEGGLIVDIEITLFDDEFDEEDDDQDSAE